MAKAMKLLALSVLTLVFPAVNTHASIPAGGTYTGCLFKSLGTVRLIDSADPKQRCLAGLEVLITWNQTGPQGSVGLQGPAGPQGPQGLSGLNGINGVDGFPGQKGDTGPAGPAGAAGPVGPAGPQGIQGVQGLKGADGSSVVIASLGPRDDANCPNGGTRFSAGGAVGYACNGAGSSTPTVQQCVFGDGQPKPRGMTCDAGINEDTVRLCDGWGHCQACVNNTIQAWVDNLDGTITDAYHCLVWEKKTGTPVAPGVSCTNTTDCPDPHNVNYRFSLPLAGTVFLSQLNGASFAGHSDWRLPGSDYISYWDSTMVRNELGFLRTGLGVIGPVAPGYYWSGWSVPQSTSNPVAVQFFSDSIPFIVPFDPVTQLYVRAVRGPAAVPAGQE
jgi:hypothetical protein